MPKTPDEIKKGLECCTSRDCGGSKCPYFNEKSCNATKSADALAYIQQLESGLLVQAGVIATMRERMQQLVAERDALLKYITDSTWAACDICKHGKDGASAMNCKHIREVGVPCFEWCGLPKEEAK